MNPLTETLRKIKVEFRKLWKISEENKDATDIKTNCELFISYSNKVILESVKQEILKHSAKIQKSALQDILNEIDQALSDISK